jgi:hypothetical protein
MNWLTFRLNICLAIFGLHSNAQSVQYNLQQMIQENKIATVSAYETKVLRGDKPGAITTRGIVWLKGIDFTKGTIDIDLRGKNEQGQSFLGIAFSGKDTNDYECLYFRPFNFKNRDPLHQKHMVQYMSLPDHDWQQLRNSQPLVFEYSVHPIPDPNDWFHATIVVSEDSVRVYVNHDAEPSLKVKRFRNHAGEKIGLWSSALPGDFANLDIKP